MGVLHHVCNDAPRPIREINPGIPDLLIAIIDRLLEKKPDDRFQSASEVGELLSQYLVHLQQPTVVPLPEPVAAGGRTKLQYPRRSKWYAGVLVALMLLGSLGVSEATGVTNLAGTVVRIALGEGTLVIEVDDPSIEISLDGEELTITGAGIQELRLRPGQYEFQATKDGAAVQTELISITRGDRKMVKVRREPPPQATDSERDTTHGGASVQTARLGPSEAVQHYSDIIRLRPDVALAYVYRADAYRIKGDYEKAINDCTTALRIDQTLADAFQKRGRVYYEMEAYPKAIADLNESIRLDPENSSSYQTRGAAFFGMGRYEDALADVNKTLELAPNSIANMMIRAQILVMSHRTKDYQQACAEILDRFSESKDPEDFCHAARLVSWPPTRFPIRRGLLSWQPAPSIFIQRAIIPGSGCFIRWGWHTCVPEASTKRLNVFTIRSRQTRSGPRVPSIGSAWLWSSKDAVKRKKLDSGWAKPSRRWSKILPAIPRIESRPNFSGEKWSSCLVNPERQATQRRRPGLVLAIDRARTGPGLHVTHYSTRMTENDVRSQTGSGR